MNARTTIVAVALAFGLASAGEGMSHEGHAAVAAKDKAGTPAGNPKQTELGKPSEYVASPTPGQLKAAKPATNKFCPVSHDKLGGMGAPIQVIWKGQAYALCCGGCVQEFAKDPARYAAVAAKEKP